MLPHDKVDAPPKLNRARRDQLSNLSAVEWMEFRSLHDDALAALERAAGNAMLTVQATSALRVLFVRAKLI